MLIKEAHKEYLDKIFEELDSFDESEIKDFFKNLSIKKAEDLGFRPWGEGGLYLIPECFLDLLPTGLELQSIAGKKVVYDGTNIDTDTRFGLLAYGIILKK